MTEKPILFSGPMVRAILDGRKTKTRRMVKPQPPSHIADSIDHWCDTGFIYGFGKIAYNAAGEIVWPRSMGFECNSIKCPYPVGTRLWVKETWRVPGDFGTEKGSTSTCVGPQDCEFMADFAGEELEAREWRPSIFMPRWASRILLEVTAVKVERLQDIDRFDCYAEGIDKRRSEVPNPRAAYAALWDTINGKGSWASNPWVWAYTFRRLDP